MTDAVRYSRRGLIGPFLIVGLVLAAWTVWWFYLVSQIETRLQVQAEALRDAGWTVELGDVSTTGWPFRARVAIDSPCILAPSGQGIVAPDLVAEAAAWNPDRWVVVAPDGLTLERGPKGRIAIAGPALRFSVSGLTQRFPRMAFELAKPVFSAAPGAEAFPLSGADRITFETRANAASANDLDVRFFIDGARGRAGGPVEGMTGDGTLGLTIEAVVEDAATLKGADTAGVFAAWSQAGGRFTRIRGEMSTGESRATFASEALSAGADGRLSGQLSLKAAKPSAAMAGLARSQSGAVNRAGAAGAAVVTAGGDRDIDLTVQFRDGRTWLGPFALAPAPKLF